MKRQSHIGPFSQSTVNQATPQMLANSSMDVLRALLRHLVCVSSECVDLSDTIDIGMILDKTVQGMCDGITYDQMVEHSATVCSHLLTTHPNYGILASRMLMTLLHSRTENTFLAAMEKAHTSGLVSVKVLVAAREHERVIEDAIVTTRDFDYSYLAVRTLLKSYLLKKDHHIERPQYMHMRVALSLWPDDIQEVLRSYDMTSRGLATHASPTLFNAGTLKPQMASCFLQNLYGDILEQYSTLSEMAAISHNAGGVGLNVSGINDVCSMLRVVNETLKHVGQGGNKRPGAGAAYMEPWHKEIMSFLQLRRNEGDESTKCRDLFTALWVPDEFMRRLTKRLEMHKPVYWSLFDPIECPGLCDCYGDEFDTLYTRYEFEGKAAQTIDIEEIAQAMYMSSSEAGVPYVMMKDACNRRSNQKNRGTIKGSNLCAEIVQYSSPDETAVCNLASIAVNKFIKHQDGEVYYDYKGLHEVTAQLVRNINKIIDNCIYPSDKARLSNERMRPMGLGIQGFADLLAEFIQPFGGGIAQRINVNLMEHIYYAALSESVEEAKRRGEPYKYFMGSPMSQGVFQQDTVDVPEIICQYCKGAMCEYCMYHPATDSGYELINWDELRQKVMKHGVANSLVTALMPTVSTSQILGNNESFEPVSSNIMIKRLNSGEFQVVNEHLVKALGSLWKPELKDEIVRHNGSVQGIDIVPKKLQDVYKTVWEVPQKLAMTMAAHRGRFVDQSQSLNIHLNELTPSKYATLLVHGWKMGLKTCSYYYRTKPPMIADQVTLTTAPVDSSTVGCTSCSA